LADQLDVGLFFGTYFLARLSGPILIKPSSFFLAESLDLL
jgi:hypothetical protein